MKFVQQQIWIRLETDRLKNFSSFSVNCEITKSLFLFDKWPVWHSSIYLETRITKEAGAIHRRTYYRKSLIMATTSDFQPARFESESWPLFYEARLWHWAYLSQGFLEPFLEIPVLSLHPSRVVHWYQSGWTSRLWLGGMHWFNMLSSWICFWNSKLITISYKH